MQDEEEGGGAAPATDEHGRRPYPVVAIGASRDAPDGLRALLAGLDLTRIAAVVIGGDREELRVQLGDKLVDVHDGLSVEPDRVYLVPDGHDVTLFHGVFHVMPPAPASPRLPIDGFFRALAADQGGSAIGVVLRGTGADGTYGLEAVRAEGGVTLVEEAIGSGAASHADFVLPPPAMAAEVDKISRHPYLTALPGAAVVRQPRRVPGPPSADELGKLFVLVRDAFGTDFSLYKRSTIERRIERRMVVTRIERLADYLRYVQSHPDELETVYKDCLIGVTNFFREQDVFEALKTTVLPGIFARKRPGAPLRVWVPGCATGEEAYSIAMCLFEHLDDKPFEVKIQIFATDLDGDAVNRARRGIYPANIAHDVSPVRLGRFFVKKNGNYQISRRIRDIVVFAVQDVTRGPPFSRVDLISCRNLLIYLEPAAQKKVLRILHYALNPDGVLVLGSSETIGECADLFTIVDKQHRIFAKKNIPSVAVFDVTFGAPITRRVEPPPQAPTDMRPIVSLQQYADRKVLERYGPPGVLVNENLEVLQFRGRIGGFLEPMPGTASLNLLKLARPELLLDLRAAVNRALSENAPVSVREVVLHGVDRGAVNIEVLPLQDPETQSRCLLVLFEPLDGRGEAPTSIPPEPTGNDRAVRLERELTATKEYLQQTIGELESANEELKSSNEELQSSNEELQSTNEELEASKEQLQSANEELNTVNDELSSRMAELSVANDDLINLLGATMDPIVVVGLDLKLRRFTGAAERLLNLVAGDVGRSMAQLRSFFAGVDVEAAVVEVIDRMAERRDEAQGADGRWYRIRTVPYRTADKAVRGVMLFFTDIDAQRRRGADRPAPVFDAATALAALPVALVAIDRDQRVVWANDGFYSFFHTDEKSAVGKPLGNLGNGAWAHPELRTVLANALGDQTPFRSFRIEHEFDGVGKRTVLLSGAGLAGGDGTPLALVAIDEEPRRG